MKTIYNKFLEVLASIGTDKYLHFIFGMVVAAFFCIVVGFEPCLIPAILIGLAKEAIDYRAHGTWDLYDLFATCLGGFVIQLMCSI